MRIFLVGLLLLFSLVSIPSVYATECGPVCDHPKTQPMAVHVYSYANDTCLSMANPIGSNRIDANFTASGPFAIHFVASDKIHKYLYDLQIIQNASGHFGATTLWQRGILLQNFSYPFHDGAVTLPTRNFQAQDTLIFYVGPFSAITDFWYGFDSNKTIQILGGANGGSAPADFGATDLTMFWGAPYSHGFVTFANLNVFMQAVGQTVGSLNETQVQATNADSSPLPCATGLIPITSNMCEQLMAVVDNNSSAQVCMDDE